MGKLLYSTEIEENESLHTFLKVQSTSFIAISVEIKV